MNRENKILIPTNKMELYTYRHNCPYCNKNYMMEIKSYDIEEVENFLIEIKKTIKEAVLEFEKYYKLYDLYMEGSYCPIKLELKYGINKEYPLKVYKQIFGAWKK